MNKRSCNGQQPSICLNETYVLLNEYYRPHIHHGLQYKYAYLYDKRRY